MSPGSAGATTTCASGPVAVNVFMKNDSPPSTDRLRPLSMPPLVLVAMSTFGDIAIMAPASADTDSPGSRCTVAIANAGPKLISVLMRGTLRAPRPGSARTWVRGLDRADEVAADGQRLAAVVVRADEVPLRLG